MSDEPDQPIGDDPIHVPYEVEVPGFAGPLELLLHLIRKHRIDILDIPISFITEKYLAYIDAMRALNLDVAGEYLEMAATLARIKSRMMLPAGSETEPETTGEEAGDPRTELVRRLLEYQKFRDAGDRLLDRPLLQRDVFTRPRDRVSDDADRPLGEVGLGALLDAFSRVLARTNLDVGRQVTAERMSVAERIQQLVAILGERKRVVFEQIFDKDVTRFDVVITLLALLEMTKLRMTRLLQAGPGAPLYVDFVGAVDEFVPPTPEGVQS
jgi:segregation and condensation protein A